jgi:hypothetical protein
LTILLLPEVAALAHQAPAVVVLAVLRLATYLLRLDRQSLSQLAAAAAERQDLPRRVMEQILYLALLQRLAAEKAKTLVLLQILAALVAVLDLIT